jgi:hypothetical protein
MKLIKLIIRLTLTLVNLNRQEHHVQITNLIYASEQLFQSTNL